MARLGDRMKKGNPGALVAIAMWVLSLLPTPGALAGVDMSIPGANDARVRPTSGAIVGRVMTNGNPAAFVYVGVPGAEVWTLSQEDGCYRLEGIPDGQQILVVGNPFWDRQRHVLSIQPGHTDTLAFDLVGHASCREVDVAHLSADCLCFQPNPSERERVGARCQVHRECPLAADTIRIQYTDCLSQVYVDPAEPDSFPNARVVWFGGASFQRGPRFTEVAYCRECREARARIRRIGRTK